jgi:uncharacterized protein YukE
MAFVIKYTKAQYEAKISELDGYRDQLQTHLDRMEGLKDQINQFWDDDNARETYRTLTTEIRQVRNAMDRTDDALNFYKSAIEKLDGANINAGSTIAEALGILGNLGI